jgi:hypothetical protein
MQTILDSAGDFIAIVAAAALILYAPFAKSWGRALGTVFLLWFLWSLWRMILIVTFREPTPPMIGFVLAPFVWVFYAAVLRAIKLLLFKIPSLARLEERVRGLSERRS